MHLQNAMGIVYDLKNVWQVFKYFLQLNLQDIYFVDLLKPFNP